MERFHMMSWWPVPKNETAAMLVYQLQLLWELNSFLMQMFSFVPINLYSGWPRE